MTVNWLTTLLPSGKGWRKTIEIAGKPLEVACTKRAARALAQRREPLVVEMELALTCLTRKTVRFHEQLPPPDAQPVSVTEKLAVYAQTVIPDRCETNQTAGAPHVEARRFVPKQLWIDFQKGQWTGEYSL